jgi:hypothetical protein
MTPLCRLIMALLNATAEWSCHPSDQLHPLLQSKLNLMDYVKSI